MNATGGPSYRKREGEEFEPMDGSSKTGVVVPAKTLGGAIPVLAGIVFCAAALLVETPWAFAQNPSSPSLSGASLEELMDIEVTSVSRKEQSLSKTGAAVFVIGQEDVRRSGAANIPDLLRMVPGVEVAQIDASHWAIAVRGFNSLYSNKVLVLIDGRTVYVNTFSGVMWDQINVPLEDIERIEVIRGPGGTIWGANAVNGVINIITKNAAETKGALITAGSGSIQSADALAQYGGGMGPDAAYRVLGRFLNVESSSLPGGARGADGWRAAQTGGRSDWDFTPDDALSVQGDFLSSHGGGSVDHAFAGPPPVAISEINPLTNTSGDLLVRWDHNPGNGSSTSLQIYDNAMRRNEEGMRLGNNTLDLDFEHRFHIGRHQDVVWGLDFRGMWDDLISSPESSLRFTEPHGVNHLYAGFLQDEVQIGKSLFLTLGSKLEHNSFTGIEYEPSAQLVWSWTDRYTLWASAARAIRQPDRSDYDTQLDFGTQNVPGFGTALITVSGDSAVQAETLKDFEGGYRARINGALSLDLTGFLSFYDHLQTSEPGPPQIVLVSGEPILILPLTLESMAHARNFGAEFFATWRVRPRWKLNAGYSLIHMDVQRDAGSQDRGNAATAGSSPSHQFEIRSMLNLRGNIEWDNSLKYVSSLPGQNIAAYARLDTRLGWKLGEYLELSICGQNLGQRQHLEFLDTSSGLLSTEVHRAVFAKLTWRY